MSELRQGALPFEPRCAGCCSPPRRVSVVVAFELGLYPLTNPNCAVSEGTDPTQKPTDLQQRQRSWEMSRACSPHWRRRWVLTTLQPTTRLQQHRLMLGSMAGPVALAKETSVASSSREATGNSSMAEMRDLAMLRSGNREPPPLLISVHHTPTTLRPHYLAGCGRNVTTHQTCTRL